MAIQVTALKAEHLPEAAALFLENLQRQRQAAPALPSALDHPAKVEELLSGMLTANRALVVLEDGQLSGYLCWYVVERFRDTRRRGAYVPEWGHAAREKKKTAIYRALYSRAAALWTQAGCGVHAVTLLEQDHAAREAWFWNGFGLAVVDALRPMQPIHADPGPGLEVRKAGLEDATVLSELDAEHWEHYVRPPVFMPRRKPQSAPSIRQFLAQPKNSIWLASQEGQPAGFMRFDGYDFDGVDLLTCDSGIFITGAYTRPLLRGHGAASALLDAALQDYAARGLDTCLVTFETFNPEAAAFWTRYFQPVCYSLLRIPENIPAQKRNGEA